MKTGWDPRLGDDPNCPATPEACPRCGRVDGREHLLQTKGVAFYRCAACGHMFIVRSQPAVAHSS
jgi:DNA-directed RNA polymerase subunit M/transcription elongation factor TFIIS